MFYEHARGGAHVAEKPNVIPCQLFGFKSLDYCSDTWKWKLHSKPNGHRPAGDWYSGEVSAASVACCSSTAACLPRKLASLLLLALGSCQAVMTHSKPVASGWVGEEAGSLTPWWAYFWETHPLWFSWSVVSDSLWPHGLQASLPFIIFWSSLTLMSTESVMPSNHLILCRPLLLPSIFPSIRVFANEFVSGGQNIRVSGSASVLPMNIPLGLTGLTSLLSMWLSGVFSRTAVRSGF